jgi:hypothetical protein
MYDLPRTIPGVKMLLALAPEVLASTTPPPPEEKERGEVSYGQSAERTVGGGITRPASRNIRGSTPRRGIAGRSISVARIWRRCSELQRRELEPVLGLQQRWCLKTRR